MLRGLCSRSAMLLGIQPLVVESLTSVRGSFSAPKLPEDARLGRPASVHPRAGTGTGWTSRVVGVVAGDEEPDVTDVRLLEITVDGTVTVTVLPVESGFVSPPPRPCWGETEVERYNLTHVALRQARSLDDDADVRLPGGVPRDLVGRERGDAGGLELVPGDRRSGWVSAAARSTGTPLLSRTWPFGGVGESLLSPESQPPFWTA